MRHAPSSHEPWSAPVDPDRVRHACAAILVADIATSLADARTLLDGLVDIPLTDRDRIGVSKSTSSSLITGSPPSDPFARCGPWFLVPGWPRPLVWDAVNLLLYTLHNTFALDAVTPVVTQVRARGLVPAHEVFPDLVRAQVALRRHRLDEVAQILDPIITTRVDLPLSRRALTLELRAFALSLQGQSREGRDMQREAVMLYQLGHDAWSEAGSIALLGLFEQHSFDIAEGVRLLTASRVMLEEQGQRFNAYQTAFNLGIARYKQGRVSECLRIVDEIEEPLRCSGMRQGWLLTRLVRAKALMVRGDAADASAVAASVIPTADEQGWARERVLALEVMGDAALHLGMPRRAREHYSDAYDLAAERAPRGDLVVGLMRRLGQVHLVEGCPGEAIAILRKARQLATEAGELYEEEVAGRLLADAQRRLGMLADAWRTVREAEVRVRAHGAELELARTLIEGARIQFAWTDAPHNLESAWSLGSEARDHLVQLAEFPVDLAICETLLADIRTHWHASLVWSAPAAATPRASISADAVASDTFVAVSPPMVRVAQLVALAAASDDAVLITGETGTGKEMVARRIQELSHRAGAPFVAVNCAAVPANVFEREFFGHARGAYTGADTDAPGLVERAAGGTLLLDEVGELPPELQAKLLRLVQEHTFRRLGETQERHVSLRILAATNADLLTLVASGHFRQDLYFRLQTLEIHLPPLRDRGPDIPALARHFAHAARTGSSAAPDPRTILGADLWNLLPKYAWPGNIRELAGLIRRAYLVHQVGRPLTDDMLPRGLRTLRATLQPEPSAPPPPDLASQILDTEATAIRHALTKAHGSRTDAARLLGISRKSLYSKLKRLEDPQ